ncbi:MAG: glycerol-3-phosphate acyltransferase, partial [Wolbachia sp.]
WLKFSGGKGVATTLGILIAFNIDITLVFVIIWIIVFLAFRYSSLASLSATSTAVAWSFFFQRNLFLTLLIIGALVFLKHHRNIVNLLQGKENKFL